MYTFRGHEGPVLVVTMNPRGDMCYSGGLDSAIHCWNLPNPNVDPYDAFELQVLNNTLR